MDGWKVTRSVIGGEDTWQVWRQTRPLDPGEPMHSGVRETRGAFMSRNEAQQYADQLNGGA